MSAMSMPASSYSVDQRAFVLAQHDALQRAVLEDG